MKGVLIIGEKENYEEEIVIKQSEIIDDDLRKEIEDTRSLLNKMLEENKEIINKEIIEVSEKLDDLILRYIKN